MIDIEILKGNDKLKELAKEIKKEIDKSIDEVSKKENYTLDDLRQNLINCLYNRVGKLEYSDNEIELLKIILEYEK